MDYTILFSRWNQEDKTWSDEIDHVFTESDSDVAWWRYVNILAEHKSIALGPCVMDNIRSRYNDTGHAYCNGVTIQRSV